MKFFYKRYAPGVIRPVIPIELRSGGKRLRYEALIDSGADECILDAQLAQILGINYRRGIKRMVGGITGAEQVYYACPVVIGAVEWSFETLVGFMPNMPDFGYGVLGQKGFFENFVVKFDYTKLEIQLSARVKN